MSFGGRGGGGGRMFLVAVLLAVAVQRTAAQVWFGRIWQPASFFLNLTYWDEGGRVDTQPYLYSSFGTMPSVNLTARVLTGYPDTSACGGLDPTDIAGQPYNGSVVILNAGVSAACPAATMVRNAARAGAAAVLLYVPVNVDVFPTYGGIAVPIPAVTLRVPPLELLYNQLRDNPLMNVTVTFPGTGACHPDDKAALMNVVAQNPNFTYGVCDVLYCGLRNWKDLLSSDPAIRDKDPCLDRLSGVWCEGGRIVSLQLIYMYFYGPIPPAIGQFSQLRWLFLSAYAPSNMWTGDMPQEICQLTHLQFLYADYGALTSLPFCLNNMAALEFLSVANNALTRVPTRLINLSHLRLLDLSSNQLTALPGFNSSGVSIRVPQGASATDAQKANWLPAQIEGFLVHSNKMSSPLYTVTNHTALQILDVGVNQLVSDAMEFGFEGLPQLLIVDIANNKLSGPLPRMTDSVKLIEFRAQFNAFTGAFPASWKRHKSMTSLSVAHNAMDTIPLDVVAEMEELVSVDMSHNRFSVATTVPKSYGCGDIGCVITIFSNLQKLAVLNMEANAFEQRWEDGWTTGAALIVLRLAYNNLTSLPGDLFLPGFYSGFLLLDVSHNDLHGTVPSGFPWSQSAVLKFDGNPNFRGAGPNKDQLPSWATFGVEATLYGDALYSCNNIVAPPMDLIAFDPSYFGYRTCRCTKPGHAGRAPDCLPCGAGTIPNANQTACVSCPAGRFASGAAQTLCEPCPKGHFSAVAASAGCTECAPGTYAPPSTDGATACAYCEGKQFQFQSGQASCLTCEDDTYLQSRDSGTCAPCPTGATCLNTGLVQATKGYYILRDPTTQEIRSRACLPDYCLDASECGSGAGSGEALGNYLAAANGSAPGANRTFVPYAYSAVHSCCAKGRVSAPNNPLCGACVDGYYEWSHTCVECKHADPALVAGFVVAAWVYVVVFHFISQSTSPDTRIILNFAQMVVVFFGPHIPFMTWLSFFDFNVFRSNSTPTCVAPFGPMLLLLTGVWVPLLCLALLGVTMMAHFFVWECHRPTSGCFCCTTSIEYSRSAQCLQLCARMEHAHHHRVGEKFSFSPYLRTSIALALYSYNSITSTVILYFDCEDVAGVRRLSSYPAIGCSDGEYTRMRPLFYFLIAFVVILLPLVVLGFMAYSYANGLIATEASLRAERAQSDASKAVTRYRLEQYRSRFGVLYEAYVPTRFFYEVVVIVRRTVLISLAVLLSNDFFRRSYWLCVATIIFLFIHVLSRPFDTRIQNESELLALVTLALVALTLMAAPIPLTLSYSIGLTVLVLGVGALFVVPAILVRLEKLWRQMAGASAVAAGRMGSKRDLHDKLRVETDELPADGTTGGDNGTAPKGGTLAKPRRSVVIDGAHALSGGRMRAASAAADAITHVHLHHKPEHGDRVDSPGSPSSIQLMPLFSPSSAVQSLPPPPPPSGPPPTANSASSGGFSSGGLAPIHESAPPAARASVSAFQFQALPDAARAPTADGATPLSAPADATPTSATASLKAHEPRASVAPLMAQLITQPGAASATAGLPSYAPLPLYARPSGDAAPAPVPTPQSTPGARATVVIEPFMAPGTRSPAMASVVAAAGPAVRLDSAAVVDTSVAGGGSAAPSPPLPSFGTPMFVTGLAQAPGCAFGAAGGAGAAGATSMFRRPTALEPLALFSHARDTSLSAVSSPASTGSLNSSSAGAVPAASVSTIAAPAAASTVSASALLDPGAFAGQNSDGGGTPPSPLSPNE